jgi:hypothetical protein
MSGNLARKNGVPWSEKHCSLSCRQLRRRAEAAGASGAVFGFRTTAGVVVEGD